MHLSGELALCEVVYIGGPLVWREGLYLPSYRSIPLIIQVLISWLRSSTFSEILCFSIPHFPLQKHITFPHGYVYKSFTHLQHPSVTLANYFTWSIKVEMLLVCFGLWSVVDRSEVDLGPNDLTIQLTWKFKDSKACVNILLHCGEKRWISLKPLTTSNVTW